MYTVNRTSTEITIVDNDGEEMIYPLDATGIVVRNVAVPICDMTDAEIVAHHLGIRSWSSSG